MFKSVVLFALLAVAAAKPGFLNGEHALAYSAPALTYETHEIEALPAATSHQYRSDIISKPIIETFETAPIVQKTVVAAPAVAYSAPVLQRTVGYTAPALAYETQAIETLPGAAATNQYRTDIISKPVVETFATAPILEKTVVAAPAVAYSAPVVHEALAYSAPAVHNFGYVARDAPLAYAGYGAPLARAGYGAPLARAGLVSPLGYSGHYGHYL